jgi:molybdopterin converting factor subunit 1
MRCTVLFFAQARDLAGVEKAILDLPEPATVDDAMRLLIDRLPSLAPLCARLAVAVDEHYAGLGNPLHEGCTIALIPPVSGG